MAMLRKREASGFIWAAAAAMGCLAVLSWSKVVSGSGGGADLVAPIGFTAAAFIWIGNGLAVVVRKRSVGGGEQ
jgi:hypothetical protein